VNNEVRGAGVAHFDARGSPAAIQGRVQGRGDSAFARYVFVNPQAAQREVRTLDAGEHPRQALHQPRQI
jgi:hypothetical protein